MDVLGTVVNFVLVALTLAVIWFAWQTVRENRKATKAARDAVGSLRCVIGDLLEVSQRMATSAAIGAAAAEATVEAASKTIEIARDAHEAAERDRLVWQLRDVGQLVERIFWVAWTKESAVHDWECAE